MVRDGKISFLDRRTMCIPFGLWLKVITFLQKNNIQYVVTGTSITELTSNPIFTPEFIQQFEDKVMMKTMPFKIRDYQMGSLIASLKNRKAISLLATGAGKSVLIHYTMQILRRTQEAKKILVIVPNISLVGQLYSNIKDDYSYPKIEDESYLLYGETSKEVKALIDDKYGMDRPFLITTYQSIMRKSDRWFEQWDAVLIDEVHGVSSNGKSLKDISRKCFNAKYKLGYTGTLGENEADKMTTLGYVGPVVYTVKNKQLQDLGFLSTIDIRNYIIRYDEEFTAEVKGLSYAAEVAKIEANEERNKALDEIIKEINVGEHTILLAKHIKHMNLIEEYLKDNFSDKFIIHRIDGGVKGTVREDIRKQMSEAKDNVTHFLIANFQTGATGLNIPNLHHVIFAASYKGKIKVLQAIGRGLRKAAGKFNMTLHDMVDDLCDIQGTGRRVNKNAVYKHYEHRLEHYRGEEFEWTDIDIVLSEL